MIINYPKIVVDAYGKIIIKTKNNFDEEDCISIRDESKMILEYDDHGKYYWDDKECCYWIMYMDRGHIHKKKFTVYNSYKHKKICGFPNRESAMIELQNFLKTIPKENKYETTSKHIISEKLVGNYSSVEIPDPKSKVPSIPIPVDNSEDDDSEDSEEEKEVILKLKKHNMSKEYSTKVIDQGKIKFCTYCPEKSNRLCGASLLVQTGYPNEWRCNQHKYLTGSFKYDIKDKKYVVMEWMTREYAIDVINNNKDERFCTFCSKFKRLVCGKKYYSGEYPNSWRCEDHKNFHDMNFTI